MPVKTDPITAAKPTNAELANGINQLHLCHEDTKTKIEAIQEALGLNHGQKKVAGLSSPWRAFLRSTGATATAVTGLVLLWRVTATLAPDIWLLLVHLNEAIISKKF